MSKPAVRYESTQDPLDDIERELMDPETWAWEHAEEGGPSPDPHLIFRVRLSGDDIRRIEPLAIEAQVGIGEFMRRATLAWIDDQPQPHRPSVGDLATPQRGRSQP
jgi:hypothetical protein